VDDLLAETGAQVEIGELPVVLADDVQLQRVFQNLISNAARYHRAGVPPQISVTAAPAGGRWLFTVADNGPGVPERMRERIFKMFNRGDADPEVAGHGMGLALCRRIIDSYDGRIWVEPNPGGGSRICFTLPAARGRADGPKAG
jgi:signal transduction histidine kinase